MDPDKVNMCRVLPTSVTGAADNYHELASQSLGPRQALLVSWPVDDNSSRAAEALLASPKISLVISAAVRSLVSFSFLAYSLPPESQPSSPNHVLGI